MKLYLDAGHNFSGSDTGAQGNGLKEQDVTFQVAAKTADLLRKRGFEVRLSRSSASDNKGSGSVNSSLAARAEEANNWGADAFVSFHCNAGGGTGAETYCLSKGGNAERLAEDIQTDLTRQTGLTDRGVKTANFYVLRKTTMPAALVEMGFIDTQSDAKLLGTQEGRQKIAEGIARGICEYAGVTYDLTLDASDITPADAVYILNQNGIISQPDIWYNGTWDDEDFKWLLRKMAAYVKLHPSV
jgi:N-acetylmuramoyl-L-alanine amidase